MSNVKKKSNVTVVFNSCKAESLVSAALALAYKRGETITQINLVQMSSGDIDSAIAAVAANQDLIYVAATTSTDISASQISALTAKLKAKTGVLTQWQATNRVSAVSMCFAAWRTFNTSTNISAPDVINFMGNKLSLLTDAEVATGAYIASALVGRYNTVDPDDDSITFNYSELEEIASILDKGIMDSKINSCAVSNAPQSVINSLVLHDIEYAGEITYNAMVIAEILAGS